jgi:hypothetical protein
MSVVAFGAQWVVGVVACGELFHRCLLGVSGVVHVMSWQGGEVVIVSGTNFGPMGSVDMVVQYGSGGRVFTATNCSALGPAQSTVGGANQQVQCVTAPGVGKDLNWTVSAKGQRSAPFRLSGPVVGVSASQYRAPAVTSVVPSVSPLTTLGEQAVTVVGTNFGPSGSGVVVTYGPASEQGRRYTAKDCVMNTSQAHVALTCSTSSGVGSRHVWRVTVGEQESAPSSDWTEYAVPVVTSMSGQGTFQAKTNGGQVVNIVGTEFGSGVDTLGKVVVTYGPENDTGRFVAQACSVTSDFSGITCLTTEGTGKGHSWVVSVDGVQSAVFGANTSYGAPVVAMYSGEGTVRGTAECVDGGQCGSTRGYQVINITGQNFGPAGRNVPYVTYGATGRELEASGCEVTVSHSVITCYTVPAAGARLKWSVVIGE